MRRRTFYPSLLSLAAALSCAAPRAAVEVTVTTGDRTKLLSREADLHFTEPSAGAIATIDVDPTVTYQKMVGFGAALSDASAWLIQHKLDAAAARLAAPGALRSRPRCGVQLRTCRHGRVGLLAQALQL